MPAKVLNFYHQDQWAAIFADVGQFPWLDAAVEGYPHRVAVCLGEADDGRLVVTGLLLDPRKNLEVTSRLLRDIRLGELLSIAALSPLPVGRVKHSAPHRIRRTRPGPAGHPDEFYASVAAVYRHKLRTHPRTPVVATMDELGCSEATVHRYLQRCRELGFLDKRARKGLRAPAARRRSK
ncbi:MAG: hypothetical protein ACREN2_02155 [Candidatus Dormibacteria bacterium]